MVRKHWLLNDLMRGPRLEAASSRSNMRATTCTDSTWRWSGGGEVWVNRGSTDWSVEGDRVLPQYGFLARVHSQGSIVEAAVEVRDGLVVESSRSPRQVYVNVRSSADGKPHITPSASGFRARRGGEFAVAVAWHADDPIPAGHVPFYHFCNSKGEIAFQADADPIGASPRGAIRTVVRASVPEGSKPGSSFPTSGRSLRPQERPAPGVDRPR